MPTDHSAPVLTAGLILRPVTLADTDAVFRIHSDPATNAHNPDGPMTTFDQATAKTQLWANDWAKHGIGYWAASLREDIDGPTTPDAHNIDSSEIIGFAGIRPSDWAGREVYNLSYRFSPTVWRRGFAAQAASAAVTTWRTVTPQLPLVAYTLPSNIGSQKTALKAGLDRRPEFDVVSDELTEICFSLELH